MPDAVGLPEQIVNNPLFWIAIILVIVFFIVAKLREEKKRPEQEKDWGIKVRAERTQNALGKHIDIWGENIGYKFYRGMVKVGVIMRFDPIYKYPNAEETKDLNVDKEKLIETFAVSFRKNGLMAWINAVFFKKYEKILLDPKVFSMDLPRKIIILDPKAYVIDDSGVWSLATKKELKIVDDLNIKKQHEEELGRLADFTRVLSNLDINQAIKTEGVKQVYAEEEKAKKARVSNWAGTK